MLNSSWMRASSSIDMLVMCLIPSSEETASSIRLTISTSISVGLAPWYSQRTSTIGTSMFGSRSMLIRG